MTDTEIVANDLRAERDGDRNVRISMRVSSPARMGLPERMWFSVPQEFMDHSNGDGDPFFPALLHLSWASRTSLKMEVPVSRKLVEGGYRIVDIFSRWSGRTKNGTGGVNLSVPTVSRSKVETSSWAMFSGGVDALYTVIKNLFSIPYKDPGRIIGLVLAIGFDIQAGNTVLAANALASAKIFADANGVELISVKTNVRPFGFFPSNYWGRYGHGSCLAGIIHSVSGHIGTMYLASSGWPSILVPWATHPEIDFNWSSERIDIVHHGEAPRSEKIELISKSESALRTIRVCFSGQASPPNCGKCEKCLRTMFALSCLGVLKRAILLPPRLEISAIDNLKLTVPYELFFWRDNLQLARKVSADKDLIKSAEDLLGRHQDFARILEGNPTGWRYINL